MPVAQKGAIAFGLVYIPVELYTATQDNDVHFNQLTKAGNQRVRYVKTCKGCKAELGPEDIVRGFEYEKNKYVVVEDTDLEKIKTEKDRSIQILQFSDLADIPPAYFQKSYLVLSQKGGEKPLELLRQAMQATGKVAIGKTVMGQKETMLALVPTDEGILLETLFFYDEMREMPKAPPRPALAEAELTMAEQLVASMEKPFDPALYKDEYQEKLRDLIEKKIAGREIVAEKSEPAGNIINLMDALKQSLAETQGAAGKQAKGAKAAKPKRSRTG